MKKLVEKEEKKKIIQQESRDTAVQEPNQLSSKCSAIHDVNPTGLLREAVYCEPENHITVASAAALQRGSHNGNWQITLKMEKDWGVISSSTLLLGGLFTPSGNSVRQVRAKPWYNVIKRQTAHDNSSDSQRAIAQKITSIHTSSFTNGQTQKGSQTQICHQSSRKNLELDLELEIGEPSERWATCLTSQSCLTHDVQVHVVSGLPSAGTSEPEGADKDDLLLLSEIFSASSLEESEFSKEWAAVFGDGQVKEPVPAMALGEPDPKPQTGSGFLPSQLLDQNMKDLQASLQEDQTAFTVTAHWLSHSILSAPRSHKHALFLGAD
ncbi:hypothetical protein P7K49_025312 [Saguinus oedipus]|uniref:Islet cell autoantigen Ica1 C-terminal domain-containing protein n=1 Tax=Saguinus oedipus TaxID=9490 RepID=A0ABQ9UI72_SAGOE|nr:hypothetical protein P7K49_025312 [Saguinus oedipus]